MATHYTCDRCRAEIHAPGRQGIQREVSIEWPGAKAEGAYERETVVLTFGVHIRPYDPESPDLCNDCLAHILHEVASMLDTDKVPMETAVQS